MALSRTCQHTSTTLTRVRYVPGRHGLEEIHGQVKQLVECGRGELLHDRARVQEAHQELADGEHDDDLHQIERALVTQSKALDALHKGRKRAPTLRVECAQQLLAVFDRALWQPGQQEREERFKIVLRHVTDGLHYFTKKGNIFGEVQPVFEMRVIVHFSLLLLRLVFAGLATRSNVLRNIKRIRGVCMIRGL
jgi:hypothetical protein